MKPTAVLVETNWIVDIIAPAHFQSKKAAELLERATREEFKLYIPAICFMEARETIPRRFAPKSRSDDMRKFVRWAREEAKLVPQDAEAAFRVFDKFDGLVEAEIKKVPEQLTLLAQNSFLNVFPLSEPMLERQISIGAMDIALKPYDLAILAAMLVKSEELQREGHLLVGFCELDSDLQPWDKSGNWKPILRHLYNDARIWVYRDFLVEDAEDLPQEWFNQI